MKLMKSITFSFFVLLLFSFKAKAQDIALHKNYTLSIPPNYDYTGSDSDHTTLTDGIYTKGGFWTRKTTVGWIRNKVTIIIDLGEVQDIGSLNFNTCRNKGVGINFPSNIFVFTSRDGIQYEYNGDAADTSDNVPGSYKVEKFILAGINEFARYIAITVVPNGAFIFTDEIEIYPSRIKNNTSNFLINKSKLDLAVDSLKGIEFQRKNLQRKLLILQRSIKGSNTKMDDLFIHSLIELKRPAISNADLISVRKVVQKTLASNLRKKFTLPFIVENISPWDSLPEFPEPNNISANLSYEFSIPVTNAQYGAFVITNLNPSDKEFSFQIINVNNNINNFQLFEVPFVPSSNFTEVADPLIPITKSIQINNGTALMFIFKIIGLNTGTDQFSIKVSSGGKHFNITVNTEILTLSSNAQSVLNAEVWAYLNFPMLKDRSSSAGVDLFQHHINTVDIPPGIFPDMGMADYGKFVAYLKNFEGIQNFLIFTNYKNGYKNKQFMSPGWKQEFIIWYKKITTLIKNNGFPDAQVFLYPFDEVSGKDIMVFKQLISWAKGVIPDVKFYATLGNQSAIDTLLPLLDVAQIQIGYKGIDNLPSHTAEIWIYSGSSPSRALSPYGFYRLMSWKAFINGYKGVGFWDYADEGRDKILNLITDPLENPYNSYSVIYDGPGKQIISSRRWEAFRLGIEDYSILSAYGKKFSIEKAKNFARIVLSNPENTNVADIVRNQMIKALTLKKNIF